jgi:glycosyltransferase involved in cell wall biosynthesis
MIEAAPNSRVAKIFEVASPDADPEGLITEFVRYESYRNRRDKDEYDLVGSTQERLKVLFWYLQDYLRESQFAHAPPLSARQIAYLNTPMPLAGRSQAVTIAFYNFVLSELPSHANLDDPTVFREALYWWCVEKAPLSRLETCLVTPAQVAALRDPDRFFGEAFPFNVFATQFIEKNANLGWLKPSDPRDRAAFFCYLLLRSFAEPWLFQYIDRQSLKLLLQPDRDGTIPFDAVLGKYAFGDHATPEDVQKLRTMGAWLSRRDGASLDRDPPRRGSSQDFGECYRAKRKFAPVIESGVCLIGPIRKASGLGQAMRLSLGALDTVEAIKPTVIPFNIGNPGRVGFGDLAGTRPFKERRAINIIHVNADTLPMVFAYEQAAVFESSYNIGFFFWELDRLPKNQRLALDLVDEIWVASEYNRAIYARSTDKPVINVGMAVGPPPLSPPRGRKDLGLDEKSFVFLATFDAFSFIERKNPLGTIKAFQAAFPLGTEPVQLVLKTQNRERIVDDYQFRLWARIDHVAATDPRILIINETYHYSELLALKRASDCYVSLHRSEGWGFGLIEAMQLGLPVIATGYAGNMEFCTPSTAYLVGYDLISVREEEYIYVERGSQWADPRLDEAAALMRELATRPIAARVKGEAAAKFVKANFSVAAIGKRYAARLADIRKTLQSAAKPLARSR